MKKIYSAIGAAALGLTTIAASAQTHAERFPHEKEVPVYTAQVSKFVISPHKRADGKRDFLLYASALVSDSDGVDSEYNGTLLVGSCGDVTIAGIPFDSCLLLEDKLSGTSDGSETVELEATKDKKKGMYRITRLYLPGFAGKRETDESDQ